MEGFDPISMTYMATNFETGDHTAPPPPDMYTNMMMMPNDFMEQYSTYDTQTVYQGDEYYGLPPPQTTPSLKRFSSTFDDAFSDAVGAFETIAETGNQDAQDAQDAKEIAIEQGHKFLKFTPPEYEYALLDYNFRQVSVSLNADLLGLFFTDKSAWAKPIDDAELMCYRRNIFQVSGTVLVPRSLSNIVTEQTKQIPIMSQELVISATESTEGSTTKIITVPWKTPPGNGNPAAEERAEKEPPSIPLDPSTTQEGDSNMAAFPFHWKRLQFRSATANNGRRKELQQHFIVHLKIVATLATGGKVTVCHAKSNPIVVRGRSPRNFQSRKDILLTGNGTHAKKATASTARPRPPSQADQSHARKPSRNSIATIPRNETPAINNFDPADFQMPALFNNSFQQQGAMTAIPPAPRAAEPQDYPVSSPDLVRQSSNMPAPPPVPQKLSLTDEEEVKQPSMSPPKTGNSAKRAAIGRAASTPSAFALQVGSSPDESADLLYEYFPLSLDDWQPPVDAVYRPHVVHHINPMPENKVRDRLSRLKNKRYFSEDVG
ncbi:p53-like transcription factor [Aureobasidium pullulans]|uniref:p53-like transcription factor n=1 Tax=Aureobasidium pullulans TaxID=5580 RepID=A0A4S9YVI6_AURPU|nr:p53-like transcription factor [Aureobasidium pullulans]THZ97532.1 p53-like transcription factor [Aureobasidium pullulans]